MIRNKLKMPSFNDGVVTICVLIKAPPDGGRPKELLRAVKSLRFRARTVGLLRQEEAGRRDSRVDMVIRCLRVPVAATNIAVVNGVQYKVYSSQDIEETAPPVMDLSLIRLEVPYEFEKNP